MTWVHRLFFKSAAVLIAMYLVLGFLDGIMKSLSTIELVLIGGAASLTAYYLRSRKLGTPKRFPRGGSGGERTPVMPSKRV